MVKMRKAKRIAILLFFIGIILFISPVQVGAVVVSPGNNVVTQIFVAKKAGDTHMISISPASGWKLISATCSGADWTQDGYSFTFIADQPGTRVVTVTGVLERVGAGGGEGGGEPERKDFALKAAAMYSILDFESPSEEVVVCIDAEPINIGIKVTTISGGTTSGTATFSLTGDPIGNLVPPTNSIAADGSATTQLQITATGEATVEVSAAVQYERELFAGKPKATGSATLTGESPKITVFEVEVTELSFTGDYGIYNITDPVWKKVGNPDNPACYKKDSNLTMTVKLAITPSLPTPVTISLKADGPGNLDAQKDNISISGSEATVSGITTTGKLEDKIYSITPSFNWSFSGDGTNWSSAGTSGAHKVYAIYNSPTCGSSNFTESHIDDAVGWALNQSSETAIAHKVMCDVSGAITSGCICSSSFEYIWQGARGDHSDGMCCCRAKGMSEAMQVLGVSDYTTLVYVNERPEPGVKGPSYTDYCPICEEVGRGAWWAGFWNNWEGACRSHGAGSMCYAPAGEFEGTYDQIRNDFGPYYWVWGPNQADICTHLPPP